MRRTSAGAVAVAVAAAGPAARCRGAPRVPRARTYSLSLSLSLSRSLVACAAATLSLSLFLAHFAHAKFVFDFSARSSTVSLTTHSAYVVLNCSDAARVSASRFTVQRRHVDLADALQMIEVAPTEFGTDDLSAASRASLTSIGASGVPDAGEACLPSLRLTDALPNQLATVWYNARQVVFNEFDTSFAFRFSHHSRTCKMRVALDTALSLLGEQCDDHDQPSEPSIPSVSAPDPPSTFPTPLALDSTLSFVVQSERDMGTANTGTVPERDGSVSVDFISGSSTEHLPYPYVAVNVWTTRLTSTSARISTRVPLPTLQDDEVHAARIVLFPYLHQTYLAQGLFSASARLDDRFLDSTSLSTLCVFLDDLTTTPKLCVPISLSNVIDFTGGAAFVGLRASTATLYQQTDVFYWSLCLEAGC